MPPSLSLPTWPTRLDGPAAPVVVGAVVAGGVASAVAVPLDRPGIGWLLAGLMVAAGIAIVVRRRRDLPATVRPEGHAGYRIAAAVAALALLGIGAVRAAPWLFALCVLGALLLAAVAATGGRTWRTLAFAPLAVAIGTFPGLGWVGRGAAAESRRRATTGRRVGPDVVRLLVVGLVTGLLLLVFGSLLASADTVFADLLDDMSPNLSGASIARGTFLLAAGAALTAGLVYLVVSPHRVGAGSAHHRRLPPLEWGLPVAALNALFAIFVWVQLGTMFGWHDYVLAPDGPTYAEYARAGFGQLVAVTLLTFLVIAVVAHLASRRTTTERVWLRAQVGALCVLSMVIVASALHRMWLYQDAYGLTRLRLLVGIGEGWLGAMFLLVLAAGVALRGGWLARAVVGSAAATLLALAVANPDALIANWNVDRALEVRELAYGRPVDRLDYLGTLSADAIGAIDRLPEGRRSCLLARIAEGLDEPDPWYAVNLGRERARSLLEQRSYRLSDCPLYSLVR